MVVMEGVPSGTQNQIFIQSVSNGRIVTSCLQHDLGVGKKGNEKAAPPK